MSCSWFGLVGGYKSVYERRLSLVTIRLPHRYKLLCALKFHQVFKYKSMFALYTSYVHAQNWWYHALDLVLLVVTNRSMRDACLESGFGPHVDTNYCVHQNFHLASHIRLSYISFMWNMMLKLLCVLTQLRGS
jgi:hypothetical protein